MEKILDEISKENVLFKDVIFSKLSKDIEILAFQKVYKNMGYRFTVAIDTSYATYTLLIKEKGDEKELEKLNRADSIKVVFINEEKGIIKVEC